MAGLKTYRAKRRFGVTAEPKGTRSLRRGHAFVIQKHAARRLHYDLRLELDGVMKSWAVTRGHSLVAGDKRLAVQVEDHPIDYNKFEGTIPKGEYGGGTVMIWDRGTWQPEGDPHKGLSKGHLSFTLQGEKLHGGWHLVRMRRRPGEKRDNWLLIKQDDDAARDQGDKDILDQKPRSVKSGRTMDEIAKGGRAKAKKTATTRTTAKKKPPAKPKAKRQRASEALPPFVAPCLATLADKAPDSGNWIHEIKFDGYRLQARLEHGKVKLLTRKGLDWTRKFPSIAAAIAKLAAKTALIDGELVAEGEDGISSFSLLQQALKSGRDSRMAFYLFDLLYLDGDDLRPLPLQTRKAALAKLLARAPEKGVLRLSESINEPGSTLLKHACKLGLEGIVSKRSDAAYRSGRGHDWIKTKCADRQEFVVAGFAPSTNDAHSVGALVLGVYNDGELRYAGRTGTGFTHDSARELYRKLNALKLDKPAFTTLPKEERGVRTPVWVSPKLVAEVDFHGWTHGDRVRQASFQGLREDKPARDVVREVRAIAATNTGASAKRRSPPIAKITNKTPNKTTNKASAKIGGVTFSHPDRVYWQDAGVSKRDLAEYYQAVWQWMRPHVAGRPIALLRCPDGVDGQCFFQKHASAGIATEHLHQVSEKGGKIISIDDLDGLLALVQAGVLEIHTRGSTVDDRERADRLVFDLDPGPGTNWRDVVAAAREVRDRLAQLKLKSFVKTTGGKGLHVVLPIKPTPWDEAKEFAQALAAVMAHEAPERYIATASKAKRAKRIFIDYLRNSREATAVAPYSTRARPGAAVSTPVQWSELGSLKSASQYTVKNLKVRLARLRKDPWANIGRVRQKLPKLG
ncbi:MAG: DNA ligase D [Rhizobiales bacterium]|nr:DNA ligase D [Hyphomicrobiales bacterium]